MSEPQPNLSFFAGNGPLCTCGNLLKVALQPEGNGLSISCFRCGVKPFPTNGLDGKIFLYLLAKVVSEIDKLEKQVKEATHVPK